MGMTEQAPARDGSLGSGREEGQEAGHGTPFCEFLEWEAVHARASNDTAWLEGYEKWLRNMPEDGGREDYIARSKADYERRMGKTVDECMDRLRKDMLAKLAEYRDESIKKNIDESIKKNIDESIKKNIDESIKKNRKERIKKNRKERIKKNIEENIKKNREDLVRRHIKEATDKQIMVDNFKMFQREYIDMTVRRSC